MNRISEPMYLTIFEDGTLEVWNTVPPEVLQAALDGYYEVVDMTHGLRYVAEGEWEAIKRGDSDEAE